jgi:hypothetical protein
MTCHMSFDLGGYVLHALEQQEEYAIEQHLVGCDECLEELGELAFTASLLALVQPEDAEMLDVLAPVEPASPPSARPSARPGSGRHVNHLRRRAVMAAVATLAMGSAAVPAMHLLDGHDQPAQAVVLRGVGPAPRARAEVDLVARDGGTGLHLTLSGAPKHGWCSLIARAADGRSEIAATWPADGLGRVDVRGSTAIPAAQLSELSVVTDTGRRLVSIPVPHMSS